VLFYHSRYADRLPIGKPEILKSFPAARLRAFYDTFYRPDRMAVVAVKNILSVLDGKPNRENVINREVLG